MNSLRVILLFLLCHSSFGQPLLQTLTVEKIMRDPKWMGVAPSNIFWSPDSKTIYFNWNPENDPADSLYSVTVDNTTPRKVSIADRIAMPSRMLRYNKSYTKAAYEKNGDLYVYDVATKKSQQITNTSSPESSPFFSADERRIVFTGGPNLYSWEMATGKFTQITDFRSGKKSTPTESIQEKWLKKDQLEYFKVLQERESKKEQKEKNQKAVKPKRVKEIYTEDKTVELVQLSPDEKFVTFNLARKDAPKTTLVPNFVTTSGFTEDIPSRTKVGASLTAREFFVYDVFRDSVLQVKLDGIPGILDTLAYSKDYPVKEKKPATEVKLKARAVEVSTLAWSDDGQHCVVSISSLDFKDRWIMLFEPATQTLSLLYREHNDAWVGSPVGGGFGNTVVGWLGDNKRIWFTSEESGYCHLYTMDVATKEKKSITRGSFEVQQITLSRNKQFFYLVTNESHPGEKQISRVSVSGGRAEQLTTKPGAYEMFLSPDEKMIALSYSYTNKPWELYLQETKPGVVAKQITASSSEEFRSYPWRDPEIITFDARDQRKVYARLFQPKTPNGAAVVFVHGAGYLQNAHKWWSSYFREYMFHNLLADRGYTVLDIDYRASAGYGSAWRTGIYRHMGGKDLTDQLDGVSVLVNKYKIDPQRIGIYGGSYGGFITLMAMFTQPDVFAAGAALRPVTDWAHYNHPYTGSILNAPYTDSLSYAKSSPLYYAEGLKGALLICHGMVDTNVHFQDAVRLAQRLIELGKENWELAAYPMEDHAFVEPSSWTDEYKRILKLFEENLQQK